MAISLDSAKTLVTDLNSSLISSHQIIDRTSFSPIQPDQLDEMYRNHGHRFIEMVQYENERLRLIHATQAALKKTKLSYRDRFWDSLLIHLVLNRFGIGGDWGLAAEAWLETSKKTHSIFLETTSSPKGEASSKHSSHPFVLVNVPITEVRFSEGEQIERILSRLNRGIIVDAGLNYACHVSEFKASPLVRFNQLWKTHYVTVNAVAGLDAGERILLRERVSSIYKEAMIFRSGQKSVEGIIDARTLTFLRRKYQDEIGPRILRALQILYPESSWKQEIRRGSLFHFATGAPELLDSIQTDLSEVGIKVEKTKGGIRIKNGDPDVIESLIPPEPEEEEVALPLPEQPRPSCCKRLCKTMIKVATYVMAFSVIMAYLHPENN